MKILVNGVLAAEPVRHHSDIVISDPNDYIEAYHRLFPRATIEKETFNFETKETYMKAVYVEGVRV